MIVDLMAPALAKVETMIDTFIGQIPNLIVALFIFLLFYLMGGLARRVVKRFTEQADLPPNAELVLTRLSRSLLILAGLLVAFPIVFPSFTAAQAVEVLGISGVALGFAFRDILQNFLAGILILLTQPFKIDDQIVVNEFEGTVVDIHTRATFIRTYDGRQVVIPNSDMFTQSVVVNTAFPIRRSEYDFGIGYGDDVELAKRIMLEQLRSMDEVLDDPAPEAFVADLAPSSVNIRARWWTGSLRREVIHVEAEVIDRVRAGLLAQGIDLPFSTYQVLFHDQTEATDGDRARQREGWPVRPGSESPPPHRIVDALGEMVSRGDGRSGK